MVQRLAAIEAAVAGTAAAQAERFEGTKQLLKVGGQAGKGGRRDLVLKQRQCMCPSSWREASCCTASSS